MYNVIAVAHAIIAKNVAATPKLLNRIWISMMLSGMDSPYADLRVF